MPLMRMTGCLMFHRYRALHCFTRRGGVKEGHHGIGRLSIPVKAKNKALVVASPRVSCATARCILLYVGTMAFLAFLNYFLLVVRCVCPAVSPGDWPDRSLPHVLMFITINRPVQNSSYSLG